MTNSEAKAMNLSEFVTALFDELDFACVVRCKDCKYHESPESEKGGHYCYWFDSGVKEDGYCSYGERKDGDTDDE